MINKEIETRDFKVIENFLFEVYDKAINQVKQMFSASGGCLGKRSLANIYHDVAFGIIKVNQNEHVRCINLKGKNFIFFNIENRNYSITIKKFNKCNQVNNNKTQQTFDFINNNYIQDLLPDVDRLNFGYYDNGILCNFVNPKLQSYISDFSFLITDNSEKTETENNEINNIKTNNKERRFNFLNNEVNNDKNSKEKNA